MILNFEQPFWSYHIPVSWKSFVLSGAMILRILYFFSMAFLYCQKCTGFAIASLYIFGLWILLLVLVTDITFWIILIASTTLLSTLLFFSDSTCCLVRFFVTCIFLNHLLNLGSLVGAFFFNATIWRVRFRGCCNNSFTLCSDFSIYGMLTRRISYVFGARTWMCFIVS